jgi:hypothetical protein
VGAELQALHPKLLMSLAVASAGAIATFTRPALRLLEATERLTIPVDRLADAERHHVNSDVQLVGTGLRRKLKAISRRGHSPP